MYQFYYADSTQKFDVPAIKDNIENHFHVEAVRPTMWEEHCLECSAPLCYHNCLHYVARSDGRCKRFENSYLTFEHSNACCGQGTHIKFRKWANMMTIVFPSMLSKMDYQNLCEKNQGLGLKLKRLQKANCQLKCVGNLFELWSSCVDGNSAL